MLPVVFPLSTYSTRLINYGPFCLPRLSLHRELCGWLVALHWDAGHLSMVSSPDEGIKVTVWLNFSEPRSPGDRNKHHREHDVPRVLGLHIFLWYHSSFKISYNISGALQVQSRGTLSENKTWGRVFKDLSPSSLCFCQTERSRWAAIYHTVKPADVFKNCTALWWSHGR